MKVIILGAGGLSKVLLEALETVGDHQVVGFLDDHTEGEFCGNPILGKISDLAQIKDKFKVNGVCLGIGDRFLSVRLNLIDKIQRLGMEPINAIHKTAWVSPSAKLERGVYVGPQVVIHSGTTLGNHVVIWSGSVIEHDCRVGDNTFICPSVSLAGYTVIKENVFVGMGAVVFKVIVGEGSTIAGGSVVIRDVAPNSLVMGNPARLEKVKTDLVYHD